MHMADALISPLVGGSMLAATAGLTAYSAKKLNANMDDSKVPLMGVMGAFVFAAQMINFAIPATGSSGHLAGGMILSILLGPYAAFLVMGSIITVQALFFADGGILALGCNIINMAFFSCFIAYPLVYRKIAGQQPTHKRILLGAMTASVAGLLMGAMGVVLETRFSGISELPFGPFLLLMLPIHLAIGIVEGLITSAVVTFVWKARPDVMDMMKTAKASRGLSYRAVLASLFLVALISAGALSWFASANPDGLEWSLLHATGKEELAAPDKPVHTLFSAIQKRTAFLPEYNFKASDEGKGHGGSEEKHGDAAWPAVNAGTSAAGILGGAITMALAGAIGFGLRRYQQRTGS